MRMVKYQVLEWCQTYLEVCGPMLIVDMKYTRTAKS